MTDLRLIPRWLAIAALLTAVTIIAHEIAHYLGAVSVGAADIRLHWADITFDESSVGPEGIALIWMAGPLLTHAIILWVWLSGTSQIPALALGLGACSRNLVLLPFTIKYLLGRDVSGFSNDEVTVGQALDLSPLPFALVAVVLGVGGLVVFMRRAQRVHAVTLPVVLVLGTVAGIVLWSIIGPMILPGGKGVS